MRPVFHPWLAAALELHGVALVYAGLFLYQRLPLSASSAATQLFLVGAFLVMGAFAGHLAKRLRLPKLTGYLLVGALASPSLPALFPDAALPVLVDAAQAKGLKLINDLAIGLIALMAGAEIRMAWLRRRSGAILGITIAELALVLPLIAGAVLLAEWWPAARLPFMTEAAAAGVPLVLVAALAGAIILANSPTVVVSVLKETKSDGPLSNTVMGVSVVMDAAVIFVFTVVVALIAAHGAADAGRPPPTVTEAGGAVLGSIAVSIAVGLLVGIGLRVWTERTDHRLGWALIGLALAAAALGPLIHLKPLFCLLAAGFACENLGGGRTPAGTHRLEAALKRVANPVFVLFFVVAGLNLDLAAIARYWPLVVGLSLLRLAAVWAAVQAGARLGRAEPVIARYAWIGMISQAGVTLALAQLAGQRFPGWGETLATLVVAMVGLHELLAPVLFSWALRRAGEAKA